MQEKRERSDSTLTKHMKPAANIKRILVLSKGWIHPSLWVRLKFRNMLLSFSGGQQKYNYEFTFTSRLKDLIHMLDDDASYESQFDGIILLIHVNKLPAKFPAEFIGKIKSFLVQGGGLLAIHGAMASFKTAFEYGQILGSRFKGHGHPGPVKVQKVNSSTSYILKDELYLHDYDERNNILWYGSCEGETVPVAWTREEDGGRIFCFSLGHCASTFKNKMVQNILHDAIAWITRQVNEI